VAERLSAVANELPTGVQPPLMTPLTSSTAWVMEVDFTSDKQSPMDLRTIADWTIKPHILAVPGVAGVEVNGGDVRQLQFQFDPERLVQYGVSVEDVIAAAREATGVRGGGFIETANQRIVLQTEAPSATPAQLAGTVLVHHNGANVTLGDVARVQEAPAPRIGAASVKGNRGVGMIVDAAYGANTLEATQGIDKALDELQPGLEAQGVTIHRDVLRAADFISVALHNVRESLLIGGILVVVVLFLFLFNLRTAAISCTAIPLSLLTAVIALNKMGLSLNTMTLGGLSIAIGEVVDDAVIDVENIYRRLRENRSAANPRSLFRVVFDASIEVRSAADLEGAFRRAVARHADALTVLLDPVTLLNEAKVAELAARSRIPSIFYERRFATAGGLMAYGPLDEDLHRRAAGYVDKILKGAKPADLPVEQPTKFELVINLKTAKALGLTIPPSLLQRADEIIQ